jgi:nucleotide-binding universal stress UspA family protein
MMFERILVALDGSQLSEAALPYVAALSGVLGSELILVRALQAASTTVPVGPYGLPEVYQELYDTEEHAAREYLAHVAAPLQAEGRTVRTMVASGPPASVILGAAEEEQAGLIAIATHGRSGLSRFALGSVAEVVLHAANCPLLIVRGARPSLATLTRILVPLDGTPLAEAGLSLARELAHALGLEVMLVRVAANSAARAVAGDYLEQVAARLRRENLTVTTRVTEGVAAEQVVQVAAAQEASLIVMATHGRGGPARWVLGSVAESIVRNAAIPVLVARATEKATGVAPAPRPVE